MCRISDSSNIPNIDIFNMNLNSNVTLQLHLCKIKIRLFFKSFYVCRPKRKHG